MKSSVSHRKHDSEDIRSSNPWNWNLFGLVLTKDIIVNIIIHAWGAQPVTHVTHVIHVRQKRRHHYRWMTASTKQESSCCACLAFHGYLPYRFLFAECWHGPVLSVLQKHLPPRARWVYIYIYIIKHENTRIYSDQPIGSGITHRARRFRPGRPMASSLNVGVVYRMEGRLIRGFDRKEARQRG